MGKDRRKSLSLQSIFLGDVSFEGRFCIICQLDYSKYRILETFNTILWFSGGDLLFIIEQQQQQHLWECLWKQKIHLRNSHSGYLQYLVLVGEKSFKHILKICLITLILKISKTSLPYVTWFLRIILSLCNITESISLGIPPLAKQQQQQQYSSFQVNFTKDWFLLFLLGSGSVQTAFLMKLKSIK